jgi:hypothetical protein
MKMSDILTQSEKKLESFEKESVSPQDMINLRKSFKEEDKDDGCPIHHASKISGDDADSPKKMGHVRFNHIKFRREKEDVCNEDEMKDDDEDEAHNANEEDAEENDNEEKEYEDEEEEEEEDDDDEDDEDDDDDDDEVSITMSLVVLLINSDDLFVFSHSVLILLYEIALNDEFGFFVLSIFNLDNFSCNAVYIGLVIMVS